MRKIPVLALSAALLWAPGLRAEDAPNGWAGAIRKVARSASPAVVSIVTARTVQRGPETTLPDPFDGLPDNFRRRFRIPEWEGGQGFEAQAQGSGVIVDAAKGLILTNHHVVDSAESVKVQLQDGRELDGKVLGSDPKSDLAVVRIEAKDLKSCPLGDSDAMEPGDWVVAIGAPFGLKQTVTAGIVSAKGRADVNVIHSAYADQDFIQTDAAINPGNSGGPLLNLQGEVIGINTAIAGATGGGNVGVGFAVPSNLARRVMAQLVDKGRVVRGWIGVSIVPEKDGIRLDKAMPGSPAAKAGLKAGDLIVGIGDERIRDLKALRRRIMDAEPGKSLDFRVMRDGKEETLPVTVGEQPGDDSALMAAEASSDALGLTVQDLTPELAEQFGMKEGAQGGVLVATVAPKSPAARKGIQAGDLILKVNRTDVASVKEFEEAMAKAEPGKGVRLLVKNDKETAWVVLK